jgi:hypothetical protein
MGGFALADVALAGAAAARVDDLRDVQGGRAGVEVHVDADVRDAGAGQLDPTVVVHGASNPPAAAHAWRQAVPQKCLTSVGGASSGWNICAVLTAYQPSVSGPLRSSTDVPHPPSQVMISMLE